MNDSKKISNRGKRGGRKKNIGFTIEFIISKVSGYHPKISRFIFLTRSAAVAFRYFGIFPGKNFKLSIEISRKSWHTGFLPTLFSPFSFVWCQPSLVIIPSFCFQHFGSLPRPLSRWRVRLQEQRFPSFSCCPFSSFCQKTHQCHPFWTWIIPQKHTNKQVNAEFEIFGLQLLELTSENMNANITLINTFQHCDWPIQTVSQRFQTLG